MRTRAPFLFGPLTGKAKAALAGVLVGFTGLLLGAVFIQPWAEPKWMFLDALTAAELSGDCCHVYYGFISNLGIMLWSGTAAACLIAACCLYAAKASAPALRFAVCASVFTGWLALDDAFLLHELVLPSLGLPQALVLGVTAGLALLYVALNWRLILCQEWWVLALGVGGLAISVAVDQVFHSLSPVLVYLEDSAKFFGIVCWAGFHLMTVFLLLTELLTDRQGARS
ncbi:hypothetical protein PUV47_13685 [Pseudovibrio exalbescens]|uniref:hypothetical protein n=1 Tax=Pseudovibrio exalbescens TaxID=197461 RepID=UPI0023650061|nr:hypothetical protein [Pseudovibrio exalbescens]MDD7910975.1 hypothetical protein [Pseudovibrio exalbescens]